MRSIRARRCGARNRAIYLVPSACSVSACSFAACLRHATTSAGIAFGPDPRLEALDRKRAAFADPVLELEGRFATLDKLGFDRDVVAKAGRLAKTRARLHHRMSDEI